MRNKTETKLRIDKFSTSRPTPEISAIVPVFNQEKIVWKNLSALANSMSSPWEIIVIDDASTDGGFSIIQEWAHHIYDQCPNLSRIRVYQNARELFETKCDSFGFTVAAAPYLLEVQVDMEIYERGFDEKLLQALAAHEDVFMISGRGAEPLLEPARQFLAESNPYQGSFAMLRAFARVLIQHVLSFGATFTSFLRGNRVQDQLFLDSYGPSVEEIMFPGQREFESSGRAGRLGALIDIRLEESVGEIRTIWLGQTIMRGPLMIDRALYESLGGLDANRFFLGNDDHDLAYRGFRDKSLRCGFVPVGFASPLSEGTTRKRTSLKTKINKELLRFRLYQQRHNTGLWALLQVHEPRLPTPEIRAF